MPAILVETAFISNSSDANLLNTRQTDFSIAIANSILSYFNGRTIDTSYILSQAKNIGLLKGTSLEFALLEAETPIKVVSVFPTITMSASVAITRKLNSLNSTVMNFAVDSNGLSAQFINKLGENRIDFSQKNWQKGTSKATRALKKCLLFLSKLHGKKWEPLEAILRVLY